MRTARAIAALAALAALGAHAGEPSRFLVEVEVSKLAAHEYVAQFRVLDAASHEVLGEPAVAFSAEGDGPVSVAARHGGTCVAGGEHGYCIDFVAGAGGRTSAYEGIITDGGQLHSRGRAVAFARD